MAAGIALSRANVEGPSGGWADVSVLVRNNRLTVTERGSGTNLLTDDTVSAVVASGRKQWTVTTTAGTFTVTRAAGCGCGR